MIRIIRRATTTLFLAAWCCGVGAGVVRAAEDHLPTPPLPRIERIEVDPAELTLTHARDAQHVLVWGVAADGRRFDLTGAASFEPVDQTVSVDDRALVHPVKAGDSVVTVRAAGREAKLRVAVAGEEAPRLGFVRDIMPVMSQVGCNAGTCHGAQDGKNGFILSLRGYDAKHDYRALVYELQGRRVNRVEPEKSLMLLKPTGGVPHEGGRVFSEKSRAYQMMLEWISDGAPYEAEESLAKPSRIEVLPAEVELDLPGRTQRLIVRAYYPDGTMRDVTRDAVLSSNDNEVARIQGNEMTAVRRGEAAILVRFEGHYGVAGVSVMGQREGFAWQPMPENSFIDRLINAKLEKREILPSELATDAEFVRRLHLDLTGVPPTVEQARAFIEDATPSHEKREKLIDALLGSRDYVAYWSNKWADLLQCNAGTLGQEGVWVFREWIRSAIARNMPYDQFVHELISAQGSSLTNPPVAYLRTLGDTDKMTEDISQTFLGVRFNCNKCHNHPFERWTQDQYYEFAAFFSRVRYKNGQRPDEVVAYTSFDGGEVVHPRTNMEMTPRVPFGSVEDSQQVRERHERFAVWLTSADNPLFARSYANRVWSYFFGRGIIDPVDDIRASNPPSNPELLDALTEDFIASGFDAQHLVRRIVRSRAYQLSVAANRWNEDDTINFSRFTPRRLSAEQIKDAVALATGSRLRVPGLPAGMRTVYAPDGQVGDDAFLSLFGRPKRESACECERTSNLSLAHALNLINGPVISDAVIDPDNAIAKLVAREPDNAKVIEELYYMVLSRPPTAQEVAAIDLGSGEDRLPIAQDLAWALLNSPAFLFNR